MEYSHKWHFLRAHFYKKEDFLSHKWNSFIQVKKDIFCRQLGKNFGAMRQKKQKNPKFKMLSEPGSPLLDTLHIALL